MSFGNYRHGAMLAGPWGGQDGYYWDDGVHSTIRQMFIAHGYCIHSITVQYDDNGTSVWSQKHGSNGGAKVNIVSLDYPDEFLTSIRGHYGTGQDQRHVIILSLTFQSNKRIYGPYGVEQGMPFSSSEMNGKIVGFLGKSGSCLHSIGVYVQPLHNAVFAENAIQNSRYQYYYDYGTDQKFQRPMMQGNLDLNFEKNVSFGHNNKDKYKLPLHASRKPSADLSCPKHNNDQIEKEVDRIKKVLSTNVDGLVTYGPWGGIGGSIFDDGSSYDGIKQINLKRNLCIVSIKVCYVRNGKSIWGSKNGGKGSFKKDKIVFDYPSEILTHITGYYGPALGFGPEVIKSLTFHTTKGKYGPYGEEQGKSFSTNLKDGSVVIGFHGRKGLFIDAIGVHVLERK